MNKKSLVVFVCLTSSILISPPTISAVLLSYEGFNYTAGSTIVGQNGGSGFSAAWIINGGGGTATNLASSLSYRDSVGNTLTTSGGSLFLQGATTDAANSLASQPSRTLSYARGTNAGATDGVTTWFSFLAVRQGPVTNAFPNNPYPRAAGISLYNTGTEKLGNGNTTPANGGVSNVVSLLPLGNTNRPSNVPFSQTNLIVVRVDHISGGLDNAFLFVNPPLGVEPSTNNAATNTLSQFDFTLNRIRPFAGGDRSTSAGTPFAELVIDEIRLGETFADVTPFRPALRIVRDGNQITLTWNGDFSLVSAGDVQGPYTSTGATSPYSVNISETNQFFGLETINVAIKPASQ